MNNQERTARLRTNYWYDVDPDDVKAMLIWVGEAEQVLREIEKCLPPVYYQCLPVSRIRALLDGR